MLYHIKRNFFVFKFRFEYVVNPPSAAENLVRNVRLQVTAARQATQPYVDGICETYQTGKSHVDSNLSLCVNIFFGL